MIFRQNCVVNSTQCPCGGAAGSFDRRDAAKLEGVCSPCLAPSRSPARRWLAHLQRNVPYRRSRRRRHDRPVRHHHDSRLLDQLAVAVAVDSALVVVALRPFDSSRIRNFGPRLVQQQAEIIMHFHPRNVFQGNVFSGNTSPAGSTENARAENAGPNDGAWKCRTSGIKQ